MVATRLMNFEEFETMPDDGRLYELVDGKLREMPAAGFEHGGIGGNIYAEVRAHVLPRRLGRAFTDGVGYRLFAGRDLVYVPDVSFVSTAQIATIDDYSRMGLLAPDLVVEVVSPTDRMSGVLEKVRNYLAAGVRLVWVVEPRRRTVTAFTPDGGQRLYVDADVLDGGDVLPDFRLAVADIFDF